jgi:hypothetical protein
MYEDGPALYLIQVLNTSEFRQVRDFPRQAPHGQAPGLISIL